MSLLIILLQGLIEETLEEMIDKQLMYRDSGKFVNAGNLMLPREAITALVIVVVRL